MLWWTKKVATISNWLHKSILQIKQLRKYSLLVCLFLKFFRDWSKLNYTKNYEIHEYRRISAEKHQITAEKRKQNGSKTEAKHSWKLLLRSCMMRNLMGNPNLRSEFQKNAFKYALRVADPWGANRPAGGWPPEERIIMTPWPFPNYYPFRNNITN
mgnify:CR=1 FL=1